jgi:hypothetical protein
MTFVRREQEAHVLLSRIRPWRNPMMLVIEHLIATIEALIQPSRRPLGDDY